MNSHLSSLYITIEFKPPNGRWRAALASLVGVAPDGVYTARYVTIPAVSSYLAFSSLPLWAVIFCCTFLKVSLTGRYPASLLCGARTFLVRCLSTLLYATIQFTILYYTHFLYFCQASFVSLLSISTYRPFRLLHHENMLLLVLSFLLLNFLWLIP